MECLKIHDIVREPVKLSFLYIKRTDPYVKVSPFLSVPGMALIQSEINRPQVFTAKCTEPQADTIKVGVKEVM